MATIRMGLEQSRNVCAEKPPLHTPELHIMLSKLRTRCTVASQTNSDRNVMNIARSFVAVALLSVASFAWAYQVTGPVLEVSDSKIVVQKGKERWEIARAPNTKITGDLKVGSKVTIEYSMTAKSVDVKSDKEKKK